MQNQQHISSALNRLIVGANQSFDLHGLWQNTSRTLSNLDFEHQHEMQRLERSRTDPMLKKQIVDTLTAKAPRAASALRDADCRTPEAPLVSHGGRPSGGRLIRFSVSPAYLPLRAGTSSALSGRFFLFASKARKYLKQLPCSRGSAGLCDFNGIRSSQIAGPCPSLRRVSVKMLLH